MFLSYNFGPDSAELGSLKLFTLPTFKGLWWRDKIRGMRTRKINRRKGK